jgi:hypothetical protein
MKHLIESLFDWFKDPFGRKRLVSRHSTTLQNMIVVKELTKQTTQEVRYTRGRRVLGGSNIVDKAVLGNRHVKRKQL